MAAPRGDSPFYEIRRSLVLLRWMLGFPLQAKDESYTEFIFITWLECLRFFIMLLLTLAGNFYILGVIVVLDLSSDDVEDIENDIYLSIDNEKRDWSLACHVCKQRVLDFDELEYHMGKVHDNMHLKSKVCQ